MHPSECSDHAHPLGSVLVYSPAGVVPQAASARRAVKRLKAMGFEAALDESALARHQRFAGDDDMRLSTVHRVATLAPDVALATRGGYGLTRLLDRINWSLVARSVEQGTAWVGYSDLTAFHLAAMAHKAAGPSRVGHGVTAGLWAGPMACGDFGDASQPDGGDDVTQACFAEAVTGLLEATGFRTEAGFDGLDVQGTLWGGNLSVLVSLPTMERHRYGALVPSRITTCATIVNRMMVLRPRPRKVSRSWSGVVSGLGSMVSVVG